MAQPTRRTTKIQSARTRAYDDDAFVHNFAVRGAREIIVMDPNGRPMRSTVSQRRSYAYASHLHALAIMARNVVRDLDPANDVTFMRLRSNRQEVHISITQEFILVVIQRLKKQKE
ncbi:dynein light chain roadblock-type 1 [Drosophila sulfurigaster albostrigata]|uniref:dynein light chain roadblock-type 1 n=1 Tax=Drosophila sulfurigaster albostrigata TaxID=89887 RepID=UPI002D21B63A|nr:dynein light chain roadblock-type 1 [Drosophila sulfurigaster albostrigata]